MRSETQVSWAHWGAWSRAEWGREPEPSQGPEDGRVRGLEGQGPRESPAGWGRGKGAAGGVGGGRVATKAGRGDGSISLESLPLAFS